MLPNLFRAIFCSDFEEKNGAIKEHANVVPSVDEVKLSNKVFPELFPKIKVTKKVRAFFVFAEWSPSLKAQVTSHGWWAALVHLPFVHTTGSFELGHY